MKNKVIFNIAKTELKMIFSTPVAWMMLIVFMVLCGLFFSDVFAMYVNAQAAGNKLSFVTNGIFCSDSFGLFPKVQAYLFLFIPLVTMGIISKDSSTGAIRLLYSSPVTDTKIVLGKYLAMVGFGLAMIAVVLIYVIFGCIVIEHPDIPLMLTGLLGLFLLICTYAAIGVFMSSLTSYQVVAALTTFAVLAALNYVNNLGQSIVWVREITWWLSISGRCEEFINGLICSEDVIYFIVVSALFLSLAVVRISGKRRSRNKGKTVAIYFGIAAVAVIIGWLSSRPALMCFHDSTETKMCTLTPSGQDVMSRIKGPVDMVSYVNILDEEGFYLALPSRYTSDVAYIRQYLRFKPDINVKSVYYWADAGSKSVKTRFPDSTDGQREESLADVYEVDFDMFLSPEELAKQIDLSGEGFRLVRKITTKDGDSTFLRIFDDGMRLPQEKEITAAFKRLVDGSVPVGFMTGHGERSIFKEGDSDYFAFANSKSFRHSLLNNGFDAVDISLGEEGTIPADIKILVIADPKEAFSEHEMAEIKRYIDNGGDLILATEPGHQQYADQIASLVGARFLPGRLVVPEGDGQQNLVLATVTDDAVKRFPSLKSIKKHDYKITMPNAVGIEVDDTDDFDVLEYLISDSLGWNELQTIDFANTVASFEPETGEKQGAATVGVQLSRALADSVNVQKILLLGDADCFSNSELQRTRYAVASGNFSLLYEVFRWLSDGQYPIDTDRPKGSDNGISAGIGSLTFVKWLFAGIIPGLMLLVAVIIFMRRKSR